MIKTSTIIVLKTKLEIEKDDVLLYMIIDQILLNTSENHFGERSFMPAQIQSGLVKLRL